MYTGVLRVDSEQCLTKLFVFYQKYLSCPFLVFSPVTLLLTQALTIASKPATLIFRITITMPVPTIQNDTVELSLRVLDCCFFAPYRGGGVAPS